MKQILDGITSFMALNSVIWLMMIVSHAIFFILYRLIWKVMSYSRLLMSKQDKDLEKQNMYLKEIIKILKDIEHDKER